MNPARVVIFGAEGTLGQSLVRVFQTGVGTLGSPSQLPPPQQKPLASSVTRERAKPDSLVPSSAALGDDIAPPLLKGEGWGEVVALTRRDCDITDAAAVGTLIARIAPTMIINAAAYNDVDAAESNRDLALAVNAQGPQNLARAAQSCGATFVHYSTDYVFDGTKKEGYLEDDLPRPISAYGESKREGERFVPAASSTKPAATYLIRTSRLFGKKGNGKESFVDRMIGLADERERLSVIDAEVSNPTFADDLALFTHQLLDDNAPSGIYHGVNEGSCTWYAFAVEILTQAKELDILARLPIITPVAPSTYPRPAARPTFSSLRNTKRPPMRSWQDALRAYLHKQ